MLINPINKNKRAFTLAEVLITLIVIGVVAAITVPVLMNNYRKEQYVTSLKKCYSSVQNNFKSYLASEGVSSLEDTSMWHGVKAYWTEQSLLGILEAQSEINKAFKVIKQSAITSPADEDYMEYKMLTNHPSVYVIPFGLCVHLADGSTLYMWPFEKNEVTIEHAEIIKNKGYSINSYVADVYIDINAKAKPNISGRDLFSFKLSNDGFLVPNGSLNACFLVATTCNTDIGPHWNTSDVFDNTCRSVAENGAHSDGRGCAARIIDEGWKMNY